MCEHDYFKLISTRGAYVTTTDLVWRPSHGVLAHWAWCVRWHVLENPAQSLDNDAFLDHESEHSRGVFVAHVLVPEGVSHHQRLPPPLHKTEGHMFSHQSSLSQDLNLLQQVR
jgi:hypothetical protein